METQEKKITCNIFGSRTFFQSLKLALNGLGYLFLCHRNMRTIFMLGIAAFLLGIFFNLKGIELTALCVTITLVFMAEIFNTAIELMIDMLTDEYRLKLKVLKDISAAVVVLACLNSLAVGYILFVRKLNY